MNCTNFIATESYGNQGKTRIATSRPEWINQPKGQEWRTLIPSVSGHIWSPCPGKLTVSVRPLSGDDYNGPELDVVWNARIADATRERLKECQIIGTLKNGSTH